MKQILSLDFDDFSYSINNLTLFKTLKEHYPKLKVTMFFIPLDLICVTQNGKEWSEFMEESKLWRKTIRKCDWIELAIHGFSHMRNEFNCDVKTALQKLKVSERFMKEMGLPYTKIFKAPYWEMTNEVAKAISKEGYTIAIDKDKPLIKGVNCYQYNWSIEKPFPDTPIVKGHGHITPYINGVNECFQKLMRLPTDLEFKFVSEIVKEDYATNQDISNN